MHERLHEFARIGLHWELKPEGRVLNAKCDKRAGLSLKGLTRMSSILPISFLVTVLCAFGAVEGGLFQELMFVGAALSATILVCSFEAWSAREIPVRSNDEIRVRNRSDY
jgi:H+/Cl- antiporter ClcA